MQLFKGKDKDRAVAYWDKDKDGAVAFWDKNNNLKRIFDSNKQNMTLLESRGPFTWRWNRERINVWPNHKTRTCCLASLNYDPFKRVVTMEERRAWRHSQEDLDLLKDNTIKTAICKAEKTMETIVKIATKHLSQLKVSQLLRLSWTTWNTQQHKYNNLYNKKSVELRERTRRFKLDKDETNRMAYRYFSLMSLSQSIKDGDMLQMYLKIAVNIPDNMTFVFHEDISSSSLLK